MEYKELIERPLIKYQLTAQCQSLLSALQSSIQKLQSSLNGQLKMEANNEVPETLQEFYAARQMETQVRSMPFAIQYNFIRILFILSVTGYENYQRNSNVLE